MNIVIIVIIEGWYWGVFGIVDIEYTIEIYQFYITDTLSEILLNGANFKVDTNNRNDC